MNILVKGILAIVGTAVAVPVVGGIAGSIGMSRGIKNSGHAYGDVMQFMGMLTAKATEGDADAAAALNRIHTTTHEATMNTLRGDK